LREQAWRKLLRANYVHAPREIASPADIIFPKKIGAISRFGDLRLAVTYFL
jgi:hypothetical protein